jgi:hypothetical protein
LLLAGPAAADNATPEDVAAFIASPEGQNASRLVRLLRSDEVARGVTRHLSRMLHAKGQLDDKQVACLDELKVEEFNQVYTIVLAEHYEVAVINRAFEFYSSPVGARYMRMIHEKSWRTTPEDFPLPPDRPREGLTMQQWQEVFEFKQSPLGSPFADPRALTQSKEGLQGNAMLWAVKALQCGVPEGVVRGAGS